MLEPEAEMRFVQTGVMLIGAVLYWLAIVYGPQPMNDGDQWITNNLFLLFGGWNVLLLVVFIISIVDGVRKIRAKKTRELGTGAMIVKLASIPYFVANFIVLAFLSVEGLAFFFFTAGGFLVVVWFGIVLTYLTMTSTSVYGWAAIVALRRERKINRVLTAVYAILLFGFFTDVAVGVMLFGHSRRRPRFALIVMLLVTGVALIALGLFGIYTLPGFARSLDLPRSFYTLGAIPIIVLVLGIAMVAGSIVVGVLERSALRTETQQAALATTPSGQDEKLGGVDPAASVPDGIASVQRPR
jgi:hypothetical protein